MAHAIKRAINFDLHIESLKKYFSAENPKDAYRQIGRFMRENGFEHRQGSGYISSIPLSNLEIIDVFKKMYSEMPWLVQCATRMDMTNVGPTYDMKALFDTHHSFENTIDSVKKENSLSHPKSLSLSDRIAKKQAMIEQRESQKPPRSKHRSNEQEL